MKKDFDDFMKLMDSKDWSLIAEHLKGVDPAKANLELTVTILRKYHN
jgi:hypothetical protein